MKIVCSLLLVVYLQINHALPSARDNAPSFIVNGEDSELGDLPHQLGLTFIGENIIFCGAALINPTQALTAAHCFNQRGNQSSDYRAYAGFVDMRRTFGGQARTVLRIDIHPSYNENLTDFDVAVLTFETAFTIDQTVRPIEWNQNSSFPFEGQTCVLSGWGQTNHGFPLHLKKVTAEIITDAECRKLVHIDTTNICAFTEPFGACDGDSGGPMTCQRNGRPILAGLTSYVFKLKDSDDCLTRVPSVYARLSSFVDFIRAHVNEDDSVVLLA